MPEDGYNHAPIPRLVSRLIIPGLIYTVYTSDDSLLRAKYNISSNLVLYRAEMFIAPKWKRRRQRVSGM